MEMCQNETEQKNCSQIASDTELVNIISRKLTCPSKIKLNTNTVQELYNKLGKNIAQSKRKYQGYIKNLLEVHIPKIEFIHLKRPDEPSKIWRPKMLKRFVTSTNEQYSDPKLNLNLNSEQMW